MNWGKSQSNLYEKCENDRKIGASENGKLVHEKTEDKYRSIYQWKY